MYRHVNAHLASVASLLISSIPRTLSLANAFALTMVKIKSYKITIEHVVCVSNEFE
jgi:hypothetical protein